jgi:hypothetical protein
VNKGNGDKLISSAICLCAALAVGGRQYYKYMNKHGFFYEISPQWGWLIIVGSLAAILMVLGILILKEKPPAKRNE